MRTRAIIACIAIAVTTIAAAPVSPPATSHDTTRAKSPLPWDGKETVERYAQRAHIGTVAKTILLGTKELPLELTLVPGLRIIRGNQTTVAPPFYLGVTHVTIDQFTLF